MPANTLRPRILFIGPAPIGDTILTTGVLEYIRETYPNGRFTLALGPTTAGLFRAFPGLEQLISVNKHRNGLHWLRLWKQCLGTKWDVTVDMRGSATTRFLWSRKRFVRQGGVISGVRAADDAARVFGLQESPPLMIHVDKAAQEAISHLIPRKGERLLVIAPGSNWAPKRWPPERFAALAMSLTAPNGPLANAHIIIIGGPGEESMTAAVAKALSAPNVIDLAGTLPLIETAALLEKTNLFIGNDSGLMHLAAAMETPTLGLFGPTDSQRYAPFGPNAAFVRGDRSYEDTMSLVRSRPVLDTMMEDLSVARAQEAADALIKRRVITRREQP